MRLLLVEDHRETREALKVLLTMYGDEVDLAETGMEGVQLAKRGDYDAVLIDIGLPDVTGWTVIDALRGAGVQSILYVVTAWEVGGDERLNFVSGYMIKPIDTSLMREELLALAMGRALGGKK